MEEFITKIKELLEVEYIELQDKLESFECWDSLTILSIIALVDELYKVQISADDVENSITIGGLKELIEIRKKR